MTVNYIAVQRNNPEISEALKRFYARIKRRAELTFRKLSGEQKVAGVLMKAGGEIKTRL